MSMDLRVMNIDETGTVIEDIHDYRQLIGGMNGNILPLAENIFMDDKDFLCMYRSGGKYFSDGNSYYPCFFSYYEPNEEHVIKLEKLFISDDESVNDNYYDQNLMDFLNGCELDESESKDTCYVLRKKTREFFDFLLGLELPVDGDIINRMSEKRKEIKSSASKDQLMIDALNDHYYYMPSVSVYVSDTGKAQIEYNLTGNCRYGETGIEVRRIKDILSKIYGEELSGEIVGQLKENGLKEIDSNLRDRIGSSLFFKDYMIDVFDEAGTFVYENCLYSDADGLKEKFKNLKTELLKNFDNLKENGRK